MDAIQAVKEDIVSIDYGNEENQLPGKITLPHVNCFTLFCRCFTFCWDYDVTIAYESRGRR